MCNRNVSTDAKRVQNLRLLPPAPDRIAAQLERDIEHARAEASSWLAETSTRADALAEQIHEAGPAKLDQLAQLRFAAQLQAAGEAAQRITAECLAEAGKWRALAHVTAEVTP